MGKTKKEAKKAMGVSLITGIIYYGTIRGDGMGWREGRCDRYGYQSRIRLDHREASGRMTAGWGVYA